MFLPYVLLIMRGYIVPSCPITRLTGHQSHGGVSTLEIPRNLWCIHTALKEIRCACVVS